LLVSIFIFVIVIFIVSLCSLFFMVMFLVLH
jgi:hypothetical protein